MKTKLYAMYDEITEEFNAPFMAKNDKAAVRLITMSLQQQTANLNLDDYKLYCLGTYDTDDGVILSDLSLDPIELPDIFEEETGDPDWAKIPVPPYNFEVNKEK